VDHTYAVGTAPAALLKEVGQGLSGGCNRHPVQVQLALQAELSAPQLAQTRLAAGLARKPQLVPDFQFAIVKVIR
jgi:hypothetical protein